MPVVWIIIILGIAAVIYGASRGVGVKPLGEVPEAPAPTPAPAPIPTPTPTPPAEPIIEPIPPPTPTTPTWSVTKGVGSVCTVLFVVYDSARAGDTVNVYVVIQNKMVPEGILYGSPVVDINGVRLEGKYQTLVPWVEGKVAFESTEYGIVYVPNWKFTFTMPNRPATIEAGAWVEQEAYNIFWHKDAVASKVVNLI